MTVQATSSAGAMQRPSESTMKEMKSAFKNLESSLKSGDLDGAKKAMATIKANKPQGAPGGDDKGPGADLDKLSQALDKGDLQAAQSSFASIKKGAEEMQSKLGKPNFDHAGGPDEDRFTGQLNISA